MSTHCPLNQFAPWLPTGPTNSGGLPAAIRAERLSRAELYLRFAGQDQSCPETYYNDRLLLFQHQFGLVDHPYQHQQTKRLFIYHFVPWRPNLPVPTHPYLPGSRTEPASYSYFPPRSALNRFQPKLSAENAIASLFSKLLGQRLSQL